MAQVLDIHAIALLMKSAQDGRRQIAPLTSQLRACDVRSAYAVADLVHRARLQEGAVAVGRKIGFTNYDMWAKYGGREPIWGYICDTTVTDASVGHQTCSLSRPGSEPDGGSRDVFHCPVARRRFTRGRCRV